MAADTADQQTLKDELTVIRCQLGERPALDELVARWHPPLWRFFRHMVSRDEQAEELVQETWVRVLRGLPRLREPARFAPWFYRIARFTLMDRLRDEYEWVSVDSDHAPEPAARETEPEFDAEDINRLHASLAQLPLLERETLTLFYLDGLSLHEVAEICDAPTGTIKSRLHRAKRMLRDLLEPEHPPGPTPLPPRQGHREG